MAAYVIAEIIEIVDAERYAEYRARVPATITAHGGRYLARGGTNEVLWGAWTPNRVVIVEFPSMSHVRAWWSSAEYEALRTIREQTTRSNVVVTEGL
jgi:uncharacterized protein (DUF1330 family)